MKRQARRIPKLAASAVASIVFGPGVKLIAVAKVSRVANSSAVMPAVYEHEPAQGRYTLCGTSARCIGHAASTFALLEHPRDGQRHRIRRRLDPVEDRRHDVDRAALGALRRADPPAPARARHATAVGA